MWRHKATTDTRRPAATGATARRLRSTTPDSVALKGDPWAIGLAAVTTTLHRMGVTHLRVSWWHPLMGTGERPPHSGPVSWVVKAVDDTGREYAAGHSPQTTEHGVGIVEAGADLIRCIMEKQAA